MGRRASGHILTASDRDGATTYSVRFRGADYPQSVILLGSSKDGWTRAKAEHEAQIVAAQIRAGTWMPVPKPEYVDAQPYTFAELASDYYHRKRRKGLRPASLADMLNKLQLHLIPFFGEYQVAKIDGSSSRTTSSRRSARTIGSAPPSRSESRISTEPAVGTVPSRPRRSTRTSTSWRASSIALSGKG